MNLWGVIHGMQAFVPAMIEGGDEGHVVNTSSGNGGIAPLAASAIYATTKAAVTTVSEVLWAQLRSVDAAIDVSVLFPGPKVLRTGLLTSASKRPAHWQNDTPRTTPFTTIESFEARMRCRGCRARLHPRRGGRRGGVPRDPGGQVLDPPGERSHRPEDPRPGPSRS